MCGAIRRTTNGSTGRKHRKHKRERRPARGMRVAVRKQKRQRKGRRASNLVSNMMRLTPPHCMTRGWAPFSDRGATILPRIVAEVEQGYRPLPVAFPLSELLAPRRIRHAPVHSPKPSTFLRPVVCGGMTRSMDVAPSAGITYGKKFASPPLRHGRVAVPSQRLRR